MMPLPPSARTLIAVLAVFLLGAVAGLVLDRTLLLPAHAGAASTGPGGPRSHDQVLAELRTTLELSPEQSLRVQEIFASHQGELETAWAAVHANLRRAMQETTREIEAELDSAQVERLHAWLAQRHGAAAHHVPVPH